MTWQRGSMLQSDIVMQPHEPFLLKKVTSRIQICQGCRTSIPHLLIAEVLGAAGVWWIWQTCEAARQSATAYHNKALLPSTFTKNAVVIHCFTFLPPLQRFPFSESDFSGITFQRQPVSSSFHTSLGESPLVSSFTLSFQLSMVSGLTSPSWTMLCLFFHFSSQPLVPLKVSSPILSAIIFDALALVYHSHNKPLISEYFSTFSLFWDWVSSLVPQFKNRSLLLKDFDNLSFPAINHLHQLPRAVTLVRFPDNFYLLFESKTFPLTAIRLWCGSQGSLFSRHH